MKTKNGSGEREHWSRWVAMVMALVVLWAGAAAAAEEEEAANKVAKSFEGIKFGLTGYLDYSAGQRGLAGDEQENYNQFAVTRGYFRFTKDFTPWLGSHVTFDVSQEAKDTAESLSGSYVTRLKYYYGSLKPADFGPFTQMKSEIGMGHMPWLDFEESINLYRCQGTMAIENAGVFNSADLGISLLGNLGGKLPDAEQKTGNKNYDGKYGSWHVGVYNGSGYHAVEANQNKVVEARVTVRPLPSVIPGLQFSGFGIFGEGNQVKGAVIGGTTLDQIPKFNVTLGMLSWEHPAATLTGQYFVSQGNAKGNWITPEGKALSTQGYSGYARFGVPGTENKLSLVGRYDYFNLDPDEKYADQASYTLWFAGLSYDFYRGNLILVDYEVTNYDQDSGGKGKLPTIGNELGDDTRVQVVYQVKL